MDIINKKENNNNILYYGYLSENELAYMYNLATLFIYPSLYEGFGLPPMEAMACGAPVVLSDIPVHREIYNGSAHFCNPLDEDDIASKMLEVIENTALRSSLSQKGLVRAKLFNWKKCAEEHLRVFETALTEG
jgi:glycosyltransferase involved in cell wall biosynthesis